MNPNTNPDQALSPEEDARLQIIEATEVNSIDDTPKRPPIINLAPPSRQVVTPVLPTSIKPIIRPPVVTPPKQPIVTPITVLEPPKVPSTPAAQMADELAHAPKINFAKFALLFFPKRKFSKKPLLLIICVLLVIGGLAIGYIYWQNMRTSSLHKVPAFHSSGYYV